MAPRTALVVFLAVAVAPAAGAQEAAYDGPSAEDVLAVLVGFVIAVAALAAYLARDVILRKKTDYDDGEFGSKRDRTRDKYRSSWHDDYQQSRTEYRRQQAARGGGDHYAVLGLERGASGEQIKARYRQLAKRYHPDRTKDPADAARLAEINRAYETLSDPRRRKEYDLGA